MKVYGLHLALLAGVFMLNRCLVRAQDDKSIRCTLPMVAGPCRALMSRFYYDPDADECKPFNYGGCSGNANRFMSQERCEDLCLG